MESLFSPSWYRVEALKPRLRSHARIHRHDYRGQPSYVLQDPPSGRHYQLSAAAHMFIGLMDGRRSVQEIWHAVTTNLGDDAPTQPEVIELLGMLHSADLLQCDVTPNSLEIFRRYERQQRSRWTRSLMNPLSLRIPLLDPDRLLERGLPWVRPLFSPAGMVLWAAVVGTALLLAAAHWPELVDDVAERALSPRNLILLWLCYPLLKALHELGHAFATKVWGGDVHEMGIVFLVLIPIPYVDASSASAFRARRRRVIVGAAGMGVELFVAALAMFVWLAVEPGLIRAIAHNLMLIGAVSTVLFNGNPLLRFDGYYILADLLEIPNLATRSNQYLGYLVQRHLFGVRNASSPAATTWERGWFASYGIASFVYRQLILVLILLFIGSRFFALGVIFAIWVVITQFVVPLAKHVAFVLRSPVLRQTRARAVLTTSGIACTVLAFAFLFPLPSWTLAEGVVWPPEQSLVRAGTDGFVRRVRVAVGSAVRAGDPLIEMEAPFLASQVQILEGRLRELLAREAATWGSNPVESELLKEEIAALEAELGRALEREDQLTLRSPLNGSFILLQPHGLLDQYIRQGELIGYVSERSVARARVVVSQAEVALVRAQTRAVEVRFASRPETVFPAEVEREVPAATDRLPSAALGSEGGGRFAVELEGDDATRALENVFQFDVLLPADAPSEHMGMRVYVRFDHGSETLAAQSYRSLRRLFLRRFGV